jgi:hypothetical protein
VLGQRDPSRPELGVEDGDLQRLLGHAVALDRLEVTSHGRPGQAVAGGEQEGHEVADQGQAGAVVELGGVVGIDVGRALPPPDADVGLGSDHQHLPDGLLPERGAERPHEGETDPVEVDGEEAHGRIIAPASVPRAKKPRPGRRGAKMAGCDACGGWRS